MRRASWLRPGEGSGAIRRAACHVINAHLLKGIRPADHYHYWAYFATKQHRGFGIEYCAQIQPAHNRFGIKWTRAG